MTLINLLAQFWQLQVLVKGKNNSKSLLVVASSIMSLSSAFSTISVSSPVELIFQFFENRNTYRLFSST